MNNKRLLYYTMVSITEWGQGISKKILNQIRVFVRHGYEVDLICRAEMNQVAVSRIVNDELLFDLPKPYKKLQRPYKVGADRFFFEWVKEKADTYDAVYIRYPYADAPFINALKEMKKYNLPVVIEIPTFPYDDELKLNLYYRMGLYIDKFYRMQMSQYVARVALVCDEKSAFGIPALNIMNGIDFDSIQPITSAAQRYNTINLIAVANFQPWHGFDRLIEAMGKYYKNGGTREVFFFLVGESASVLSMYKTVAERYGIGNRIIFFGLKYGEELDNIFNKSDIAIDSIELRMLRGVPFSSTLKSREYVARGLPVVSAHPVDIFLKVNTKYHYRINLEEDPIDIERIIKFYDDVYDGRDRKEIVQEIRETFRKICDMEVTMKPVLDYFESSMRSC